ncbi:MULTISPECIES: hypothetical protein [Actinomycetes]|uniref:Uncharacterized protein n=1 Tax=Streptomyces noursei TaxID=1971 RepID=A0A2N8P436_STRNR|nr:hypothetical protein [Streptomyces noursei]PNE35779.1 hypothetical protein AOB60_43095 [Streptomyces noursei]
MSLVLAKNSDASQPQSEPPAPRPRLSWVDLVLLVVVLGSLVTLLALGIDLERSVAVVSVAGVVSVELRRRFTQS